MRKTKISSSLSILHYGPLGVPRLEPGWKSTFTAVLTEEKARSLVMATVPGWRTAAEEVFEKERVPATVVRARAVLKDFVEGRDEKIAPRLYQAAALIQAVDQFVSAIDGALPERATYLAIRCAYIHSKLCEFLEFERRDPGTVATAARKKHHRSRVSKLRAAIADGAVLASGPAIVEWRGQAALTGKARSAALRAAQRDLAEARSPKTRSLAATKRA